MPSTAVRDIRYDPETEQLWITFVPTGHRYLYSGVPPSEYDAFRHAFAKGSYFNRHIRDRYPYAVVEPST